MQAVVGADDSCLLWPRACTGNAVEVARMPSVIKQWEGVAQIISRRMDMERKYISRLEGE